MKCFGSKRGERSGEKWWGFLDFTAAKMVMWNSADGLDLHRRVVREQNVLLLLGEKGFGAPFVRLVEDVSSEYRQGSSQS